MLKYLAYRFQTQILFLNSFLMVNISFQIYKVFGIGWFEKTFMYIGAAYFGWGISEVLNNRFFRKQQRKYTEPPKGKTCPLCRYLLVSNGSQCIETLDDHVSCREPSHRSTLKCGNDGCKLYGKMFWSKEGETYANAGCGYKEFDELTKLCIDNNNAPFGTIERKLNVEIQKADENYNLYKSDKLRIEVVWCYISNYNGNILRKKPKLQIWHKLATMHGNEMTLYVPGIRMLIHCVKNFHRMRKYNADIVKECANRAAWPKAEWWRKLSYKYMCVYDRLFPIDTSFTPTQQLMPGMKFASRSGDKSVVGTISYDKDMPTSDEKADMLMSTESIIKRENPKMWANIARKYFGQD